MSLKGNTTAEKIWNFLISKGLNECGAAGLMGNLKAESALNPMNLQQTYERKLGHTDASYTAAVDAGTYTNFVKDSAGYGLAQWTYWSRKEKLLNYARSCKASIGDLEMQLCFLWKELSESYGSVLTTLKNAKTIREASDAVLLKYERPANQGTSVQQARAAYGQEFFDQFAAKTNTGKEGGTMTTKISTAAELARRAIDVAKNHKTLYVMGCFGAPMNEKNKARYCANHSYNKAADRQAMIKAATADTFGFDCVCLIKGLLWGWSGDASKVYGGASYKDNGVPDIGADSMITVCKDVSTDFSSIEIGEAVWMKGHIGIYVGDGLAVESTPAWKNCVQITACNCSKSGYSRRNWTKHGKLPYVTYTGAAEAPKEEPKPATGSETAASPGKTLKVGDIVTFTGRKHYANANAASGPTCKPGKAKITAIYQLGKSKHPYHLVNVSGGGSTVYGWVDVADIKEAATETPQTPQKWTPKVGDVVNYSGSTHYTSANSSSPKACKGGKAKITQIYQLGKSKHPYHLVRASGAGATVYGWVDAGTFTKA